MTITAHEFRLALRGLITPYGTVCPTRVRIAREILGGYLTSEVLPEFRSYMLERIELHIKSKQQPQAREVEEQIRKLKELAVAEPSKGCPGCAGSGTVLGIATCLVCGGSGK